MIDIIKDQNDFIKQIRQKVTIIKIEKRRVHLKHKLIQIKTKENLFFCRCFRNIEVVSKKRSILNNDYIIEKKIKIENVKIIL